MRPVFAELVFPAPWWRLVVQAQSWGAGAELLDELQRLPPGTYGSLAEVLRSLDSPPPPPVEEGASPPTGPALPRVSRTVQHKCLGEGLAVGLLALQVEAITINGPVVESAFRRAWSAWSRNDRFPHVRADPQGNDILSILRLSGRRKGPHTAEWSCEGEYRPRLCVADSLERAGRRVGRPVGVTHSQWISLATGFAGQFEAAAGEIHYLPVR